MTDVLFADISEFQSGVNDAYPYAFLSFRSNDGTYRDHHFDHNLAWAKDAVKRGKIKGFAIYYVFEPGVDSVSVIQEMVGVPHPKMAIMQDIESWGGRIRGDHSNAINAERERLIKWLNAHRGSAITRALYRSRDRKRVFGYGNAGDLANIWPRRGDAQITLANYSQKPSSPKHLVHQFSSSFPVKPFGRCDINSADGLTITQFLKALGLDSIAPAPKPKPPVWPLKKGESFGTTAPRFNGRHSSVHNAQIKKIQRQLVRHGYAGKVNASTWVNGIFSHETALAVARFKQDRKLKPASGIVGPRAWKELFKLG